MIARYASAATTGALITCALLLAMQGLIRLQPGAESDIRPHDFVDWIRLPPREDPPLAREPQFERDALVDPPEPPRERPPVAGDAVEHISIPGAHPAPPRTRLPDLGNPDNPLISIVRVQPVYPPSAEQRGLEGWVDVRFDVLPNGLTTNIRTIASSDRIFERAAHDAARRFRFKAPVVDGVPQTATGIEYRFRFDMHD